MVRLSLACDLSGPNAVGEPGNLSDDRSYSLADRLATGLEYLIVRAAVLAWRNYRAGGGDIQDRAGWERSRLASRY
jgi:hypothetical protein